MQFDFKVTTWERITVPQEHEQKVLDAIKNGTITCSNDIYELFGNDGTPSLEVLDEATQQMSLEDNGGHATIEVIDERYYGQTIFTNQTINLQR